MGRLGNNPSSRGYATPTYATTPLTARETFGGTSKAGLGRHIGMGPFTYSAIVNGSSGHKAPPLAGNSFLAAYRAGYMASPEYPINTTNQLARIGTGTTGGMTRTPADGVNLKQREEMQTRVDKWNKVWPSMPQRDTPNDCCKTIPYLNHDEDHTNITANETLYGNSGSFGDMPQPPANPIGALSDPSEKKAKFTYMPQNGIQGVSFYNLLYGQCTQSATKNQFADWGTSYITNPAIYAFIKDQGFNCVRFPLTVWPGSGDNGDFGGDCDKASFTTYFDENGKVTDLGDKLTADIITGITLAAAEGLYSIIDWHTYGKSTNGQYDINGLDESSKRNPPTGWDNFFYNLMTQIGSSSNFDKINNYLIWEIFNEPKEEWNKWANYPWNQINVIRLYEKTFLPGKTEHLIIIGTNFNSQLLASSPEGPGNGTLPLVDSSHTNICFALHFYTKSHDASTIKNWGFQSQADTGNESGVGVVFHNKLGKYFPVFISECGPTNAGDDTDPPDYEDTWESVLTDLGLWANGSPGKVQPGQPIVVWALTGLDNATPPNPSQANVLIKEQATASTFTASDNMIKLTQSFFGPPDPPGKSIPTWCALAGAYVPALDHTAPPNGRRWQAATTANTEVNKFVSNFTSDTITIGPVQGKDYGEPVNAVNPNARYTSRQLFLWDDPSKPLYISYKMNLNDIYCNNSAVFFLIFPNSNCRTPASQQPPGATKNYCDAPATGPTYGRCQELDLMETDGKYYFASTWHPLINCTDQTSNNWFSVYSLFSGRSGVDPGHAENFIANISPDKSGWSTDLYLPVKHRFTQSSTQGQAIWEVEFNNNGTWYKNYTAGTSADIPAVKQQLFKSLGGDSDENNAIANGAGFRLILGINATHPIQVNNGDNGSSSWDGGTIDGFKCDCSVSEGNTTNIGAASYNVGLQAWYLQDIELENVTTISADLITQDNFDPYLAPNQQIGISVGLLPRTP